MEGTLSVCEAIEIFETNELHDNISTYKQMIRQ